MASFLTNDGVSIHYEISGSGRPLVMLHGWDQSAKAFCNNIPALSQHYQVIAVDLRGHGESGKPTYGYRISRLAMDVWQLLEHLDLQDVVLLGWSMGCSVIWSYWDLFRSHRLSKLILVDEPPLCLVNESNPDGFADNQALEALKASILSDTVNATQGFVDMMLYTPAGKAAYGQQTLEESLKFPPQGMHSPAFEPCVHRLAGCDPHHYPAHTGHRGQEQPCKGVQQYVDPFPDPRL